jgi:YihY family inner membrane protein
VGDLLDRIDTWQRTHRWGAFGFGVVKKFGEDQAGNLAALIAYYAFFSIFPLLLAFKTVLDYVVAGNRSLQQQIEQSAFHNLPLVGNVNSQLSGNVFALILGLLLALYSGLGVGKAALNAFNTVHLVPLADRPNFLKSTLRALTIVLLGGVGLIGVAFLSGLVSSSGSLGLPLGPAARVPGVLVAALLASGLFVMLFQELTVAPLTWRQVLPGAVIAGVAYELLSLAATAIIAHKLNSARSTYGQFGTVIVLLSWFYLQAQVVLLAAEVNVVRMLSLWPRALRGGPSTDADHQALELYDERERRTKSEPAAKSASSA